MEKREQLYAGKAKSLYATDEADKLVVVFRDDTSAFDGKKVEQLQDKGAVNNAINATIMGYLQSKGIETHFIEKLNECESVVKSLKMIPVECVVRNVAAGSLTRRLGIELGTPLSQPTYENFLKNDALSDPMINASHATVFGYATAAQLEQMESLSFAVNQHLKTWMESKGLLLVDFKLEFGEDQNGTIVLGDEITPDGCRIWDMNDDLTILDKDRFRKDLGSVIESYQLIGQRLGAF